MFVSRITSTASTRRSEYIRDTPADCRRDKTRSDSSTREIRLQCEARMVAIKPNRECNSLVGILFRKKSYLCYGFCSSYPIPNYSRRREVLRSTREEMQ